uniref:CDK5 regulatory subunit associated protein 3 n=1 Tax=Anser brachyrhynchus TaxID=132585 RepID=A0A8B9B8R7_9AVES
GRGQGCDGEGAHGGRLPWAARSRGLRVPGAGRGPRGSSGPRRRPAAELASLLVRSVSYEAPALRKQISRCQQAQQDFARREEECQLAAAELRERFYASCKQYGITVSPRPYVGTLCPRGVPTAPCYPWGELGVEGDASAPAQLWERGVKLSRGVCARASPAQHVPAPSPGRQRAPGAAGPGEGAALAALRGRGGSRRAHRGHRAVRGLRGVRVRELSRTGAAPAAACGEERQHHCLRVEDGARARAGGAAGGAGGAGAAEGGRDRLGRLHAGAQRGKRRRWCRRGSTGRDRLGHHAGAQPPVPDGVARGSEALTLLEHAETRNQFIDELMELELFLAQRLVEMEEEADVLAASQFQLAPAALQGQTSARVGSLLASTRALLGQLGARRMQHLFTILASPRYVDRVSELLQQKLKQAELLLAKREALSQKRQEALAEQGALEPKLDRLLETTRELQRLVRDGAGLPPAAPP